MERRGDETAKEWIQRLVNEFVVVVFSKTYCPYCSTAKHLLTDLKSDISGFDGGLVFELDTMKDGSEVQKALMEMTGRRTVPNIFIEGKSVGGADDLRAMSLGGTLKPLVSSAVTARM